MEIRVTVEGITPLILNRFTEEAQMAATDGSRASSIAGDRGTPLEQATKCLYVGPDNKTLIIPSNMLFACIINGGKFFKAGKSKITTLRSSLIPACFLINEVYVNLEHREPWTVFSIPVRNPSTGGRMLKHRPMFNDWRLTFSCELDETEINPKLMRQIVDAAGSKMGLGDYRPSCRGPYGRFSVNKWEAIENPKADEAPPLHAVAA